MIAGFTGTRNGMTDQQRAKLEELLVGFEEFHYGDCIGSDEQAFEIATGLNLRTVAHPPIIKTLRAFTTADEYVAPLDYAERNKAIVLSCHRLFAAPGHMYEELRSGTWSTVRFARRTNKVRTIIYPDGTIG